MNKNKKRFRAYLAGTVVVGICCFTPLLVVVFGAVGLSILVPYLDIILLPALGLLIILSISTYMKWKRS